MTKQLIIEVEVRKIKNHALELINACNGILQAIEFGRSGLPKSKNAVKLTQTLGKRKKK